MAAAPLHFAPVVYVVSQELVKISSLLPSNKDRSVVVHSLIHSLGLLATKASNGRASQICIVKPVQASYKDLATYHTRDYLDHILGSTLPPANAHSYDRDSSKDAEFGLQDDCPPFPGMAAYVPIVAGATLSAASLVHQGKARVAICWDGGRHHAQKACAAGFCYVADCVLCILTLKKPFPPQVPLKRKPRVMYLDLDLHFSDAVSQAFYSPNSTSTPQVLTLSIHHAAPGFYPATPLSALSDPEEAVGDLFTLSLPLHQGASNATFARVWPAVEGVKDAFDPDFVVVQCGVDGLAGDPCAKWNWSIGGADDAPGSMGWCVNKVVNEWRGGKVLLGGGGYNTPNAARAWAYLTSIATGRSLPLDTPIPDHAAFPAYAPSFTLDVPAGNMQDLNRDDYLTRVERRFNRVAELIRERLANTEAV